MFTTTAYAQTAGATSDMQSTLFQFLPIVLIMLVFYFLLIRPQQQKAKETRDQQAALRRGDRIVTGGGVLGVVSRVVNDEEVEVQIAEGVRVRILRSTIAAVRAKTEPATKDTKPTDDVEPGADLETEPKKRRGSST